uniref:Uncharacterized protein n=1 Tax=Sipha flava TaxID=143950 RepID=A0A2S2Q4Z2_9HEMI
MRALDVKSWKDFINGGFHFDKFRRFKLDETEEIKEKERKSRMKKRHGETRSDAKIQNTDFGLSTEIEKGVGIQRFNLLDRKKKILKGPEVLTQEGDYSKYYPSSITRCTKTKPAIKFSENPASATYHLQNRQQMLATLLPEIESIVHKFLSSIKPKRLKDHSTCGNYNHLDDNLLVMMKDPNIYPFKGWWPKTYFIMCQVKEDPNIEIDKDALINEFAPSKRTKKSRFNDDTSMVDIRPTVPSKWDSDYDGSPATDKVMDVEVSQNLDIITSNDIGIVIKQENNPPDISCQDEESMDTTSDACEVDPKIKVISTSPNRSQEPQVHAILDTEYEKFLKIVSAEKLEKAVENNFPTAKITKEDENNLLVKSLTSLNGDSVEDSSVKSSDDFASLHSVEEKSINDKSFVNRLSSVDIKLKKKKKMSSKKSKKNKKKESKKKKRKYSSSESSQDSESESDSSSEESDSETTDSTSSVEKKKYKSKDKKKNKSKHNLKKKNKSLKNKIKNSDDEKDNSNILNLLEKAFNVEIKMKSLDDEELKQKKKKRKHEKKETKLNEENDDDIEKVKECLKETFTKLAKNDKVSRNQSLTCDDSTVSEVLKYLNMDEEKVKKNKKSKKSFKRKRESDISGEEITPKKSKLDGKLKIKDGEKKRKSKKKKSSEKRSFDLEEHVSKKKSKKKSKMTDSSETDDEEELEHKKMKNENVHFFGLRPNEWNIKNKSSMRGVVHHSEVKNINYTSPTNDTSGFDEEVNVNRSRSTHLSEENSCLLDLKNNQNENLGSRKVLVEKFEEREKNSCESESGEVKECNIDNDKILNKPDKYVNNELKHENDELQNTLLINDNIEEQVLNKDGYSVSKLTHNNPAVTNIIINKPIGETISYRDKVKMNLKKLSTCQHIPFVFGFSSPLGLLKPINKIEKTEQNLKEPNECIKSVIDESTLLKFDKPKVVISPEIKNKKSHEIGIQANDKVFDSRLSLEESKKLSPNSLEHLNDEEQNEQMEPNVLKNKYNDNKSRENNSVSNCRVVQKIEDHSFDTIESNSCGSDLENQNEKMYEFDNIVVKREIITSSNSTNVSKFEQHIESNMIPPQNNSFVQTTSVLKDSDSICPQISNIDLESSIIDNELIVQWTSDWSKFNSSVIQNNTNICKMNGHSELHLKKSRWDEPPKYEEINTPMSYANEHNNLKDISNSFITDNLVNKNVEFKEDFDSEEQLCEIDSVVNDTRYYSENWANEYANDCSQSYELCSSFEPHYSKMKNIKNDKIIPVDYSIYENYNPSYNYHDEHYNNWKSVDSFDQLTNVAINNDTQSSIQVGNILELLPSDNVSIDEAEILKDEVTNENVFPITSESQDSIVENEKSVIVGRDEQFFKLYQQYFQHYNQNPIKYSMSEPVLDNITEVNIKTLEKLSTQEKLNTDCKDSKTVAIPLQDRGYACLVQEDDINVYLTSDNYLAYCAIEDKCMVHIALESSSLDGVGNEVRHCFNVNQNGSTVEYWLHADLIPFHVSSDVSGVFSDGDDDVDSSKSDSGQENGFIDNNDDCEDNNKYTVEGEWEIINSVSDENVDTWLDDPCILNKYGGNNLDDVDQTVADINQEGSSSSDYDTDTSDFSDSYFETSSKEKQNITLNLYQKSSENNDKNELLNIADVEIPVDITKQPQSSIKSSDFIEIDKSAALSINLDSNIEIKNEKDMAKTTLELVTENNDNNILKLEGIKNDKMKESDVVPLKEEIVVDDLSIINKIFNQQILIKKLKVRAKEKIQEKQPDTIMVHYSDNMETVKHPFLGLFQPPTISILSKKLSNTTSTSRMPKRVTFADGIHPGDNLATSPTHDDNGRPLSPPPLKKLMREMLKFKRNMYPFKKSKVRTKFTMVNKKVATVTPSIKTTTSSVIEYYISRQRLEDLPIIDTFNNSVLRSDDSLNDTDDQNIPGKNTTPPRPARELTPVPSDSECWHDDDNIKESI